MGFSHFPSSVFGVPPWRAGNPPIYTMCISPRVIGVMIMKCAFMEPPIYTMQQALESGWWLGHPSEKYESQLGWWNSQYFLENKIDVPNHQPGYVYEVCYLISPMNTGPPPPPDLFVSGAETGKFCLVKGFLDLQGASTNGSFNRETYMENMMSKHEWFGCPMFGNYVDVFWVPHNHLIVIIKIFYKSIIIINFFGTPYPIIIKFFYKSIITPHVSNYLWFTINRRGDRNSQLRSPPSRHLPSSVFSACQSPCFMLKSPRSQLNVSMFFFLKSPRNQLSLFPKEFHPLDPE